MNRLLFRASLAWTCVAAGVAVAAGGPDLDIGAMMRPVPATAVLKEPGYFVWGASMVKDDKGVYHVYYSRWKKEYGFGSWVTKSEIAHATGPSPSGPWTYSDVALAPRGARHWDGLCAHNPNIHRFGEKYYLYYTGNTGDGKVIRRGLNWTNRNSQRIGVAVADTPYGPWRRSDRPAVDASDYAAAPDALMTSNPAAAQRPDGSFMILYKAVGKKRAMPFGGPVVHLTAVSQSPTGPFVKSLKPLFTDGKAHFPAEDPYIWSQNGRMYAIIKDQDGYFVNRKGRSLVLFESADGDSWTLAKHSFISGTDLCWADGRTESLTYLERPQLFIDGGRPVALLVAVGPKGMAETYNVQIPLEELAK